MKKFWMIPILLVAIGGGFLLAQTNLLQGNAEEQTMIKAAEAKQIALDLYAGTIVSFEFDKDDRKPHYEIDIISDAEKVEIEVDAVTSKAVIKERESIGKKDDDDRDEAAAIKNAKISQDEAVKIAQAQFNGSLHEITIDEEDNRFVYEVELRSATEKAEFDIDVQTGAILKVETKALSNGVANNNTSTNQAPNQNAGSANQGKSPQITEAEIREKMISLEKAIQIAKSKVSGTVVHAELDDGKYEIEIRNGKMEYEFEIHAQTGAILSYEEDLDD